MTMIGPISRSASPMLDPNKFTVGSDGNVHYTAAAGQGNNLAMPLSYFTSGQYQQDVARYGQAFGPGGIFMPGSTYTIGHPFQGPNADTGFDPASYAQNDQGQPIGYSPGDEARFTAIDNAYNAMMGGGQSTTDFANGPPKQLGADVFGGLAQSGFWAPPGTDFSGSAKGLQASIDPSSGNIIVVDPRGGDGKNPVYTYDSTGKYINTTAGAKGISPLQGIAMVAGSALGFGALAGAAGGAGALAGGGDLGGAAAAGSAGASNAAIDAAGLGAFGGAGGVGGAGGAITGADMAAGAGLGSGAAGSAFGGIGAGGAGGGFGLGTLGDLGIGGAGAFGSAGIGGLQGAGSALSAAGAGGALQGVPPPTLGPEGVPPPANPNNPLSFLDPSNLSNLGAAGGLLGPAASLLGGALGAQGNNASASTSHDLPAFLQQPVAGDLVPRVQGLLNQQMPQAQAAGQQMMDVGTGLLGAPVAGNGVGQVKLNAPNTPTNPYLQQAMDSLGRQTGDTLARSFQTIGGNAVGVGGLGGSRQGVAQAEAITGATKNLQDAGSSMYLNAYNSDQNRALQQYGLDQNFYGQQRGQDLTQAGIGSGLLTQGLQTQWAPIQGATAAYSPFTGFGNQTSTQNTGGGVQGFLGGALGAAQFAKNIGLFGNSGSSGTPPNPFASSWF